MNPITETDILKPPATFVDCRIEGGVHHGQTFRAPADQFSVTFWDGPDPHTYHRVSHKPIFYAVDHVALRCWQKGKR